MQEEWRPVKGYEGVYEVSSLGRIKRVEGHARFLSRNGKESRREVRERIMSQSESKIGRISVMLSKENVRKRISVHRIVAEAFVKNDDPIHKTEINHKDENPRNNIPSNLEWCDRKYNMNYGTLPQRLNIKNRKPVEGVGDSKTVRYEAIKWAKKDGYDPSGIYQSIKKGKKYKGLRWRYCNE
jgi:hypothetical protein